MRQNMLSLVMLAICGTGMAAPEAVEWTAESGVVVRYRWSAPAEPEPERKFPLVIFLHGAGERGNDNEAQLRHGVGDILKWSAEAGEPCFLIAPQCPAGKWWAEVNLQTMGLEAPGAKNERLEALVTLIDELAAKHPIDPARIYLTGLSMGGYGTWDLLARHPAKFAAAAPICGGGNPEAAESFKSVPLWAFHGAKDEVVPVLRSREMIDALEAAGAKPKFTVYPDAGHDSWTATYRDPAVLRWMFDQKKEAE
jgi:predicted peptidase